MAEDGELCGGTASTLTGGKGKKKRMRYTCIAVLHNEEESMTGGLGRFQKIFRTDPTGSEEIELNVGWLAMAELRRQKRGIERALEDTDS